MPATMLTTMPKPTLVLSSPPHLVLDTPLALLIMLDMVSGQGEQASTLDTTWSPRPGHARTRTGTPWT
jgi:hypothetical protein